MKTRKIVWINILSEEFNFKSWLLLLLLLIVTVTGVHAAVTVTEFTAEWDSDQVHLHWETASETGNLGFLLWRREDEGEFEKISVEVPVGESPTEFVPGVGGIIGANYDAYDVNVTPGIAYEYQLQDAPDDSSAGEMFGPVTPMANDTPTPTSTPTPQPAATATPTIRPTRTPTANPSPSPTPTPHVQFWADQENLAAGTCTTLHWNIENIQAAHLNGEGVDGSSSKTVCPCEDVTYTLRVRYRDEAEENFRIDLSVTGVCDDAADATATATPFRVTTATPFVSPTATATPDADAPTPTPTPSPSPPPVSGPETDSPLATPTSPATSRALAEGDMATPAPSPTASLTPTRPPVEGERMTSSARTERPINLFLLIGGVGIGLLLIGVGVWLWGRHR